MSFWVHAFCHESVRSFTPESLREGIASRVKLLTYLFCPEREENPDKLVTGLTVDHVPGADGLDEFRIEYGVKTRHLITTVRGGKGMVREKVEELRGGFVARHPDLPPTILEELERATEIVAFPLTAAETNGMGFPVAVAAAATLVGQAGGLIQSGTYAWMRPKGKEVEMIYRADD